MIHNVRFTAAILVGLATPSVALAQQACYDAKIRAVPVDQVPSEIGDCGSDCIIMSWPWFVDLEVKRVIDGALPSKMVRVLTVQHTYRVSREGTWLLRKNTAAVTTSWYRKTRRRWLAVLLGLRQSSHIFEPVMDIRWTTFATRAFVDTAIAPTDWPGSGEPMHVAGARRD